MPARINSKANQTLISKDEQTEQLKNEIQRLKQLKINNTTSNKENSETRRSKVALILD